MGSTPIVPVMKPLTSLKVPLGYKYTDTGTEDVEIDILLHTLILGKSRTGKSTVALAGIVGAMRAGLPVFVIDPHGKLIEDALHYIPEDRLKDLFLVDLTAPKVPGFPRRLDPPYRILREPRSAIRNRGL